MFFQKSKDTNEAVDIGERRIKGDIDLDELVYGGKKVSRKDLEDSSNEDDDEEIEDESGE